MIIGQNHDDDRNESTRNSHHQRVDLGMIFSRFVGENTTVRL